MNLSNIGYPGGFELRELSGNNSIQGLLRHVRQVTEPWSVACREFQQSMG
jgi:hypothetical protein